MPQPRTLIPLPHGRSLTLGRRPLVMGIVNVTPDSFSDGGLHLRPDTAIDAAMRMAEEGAAILDVGGESTRPGSVTVPVDEELERVMPVIEGIRRRSDLPLSVDTRKAAVARAALDSGADIINDVSALRYDREMGTVAAQLEAAVILMHMRGEPATMQNLIHYDDVLGEVHSELAGFIDAAIAAGIEKARILVDPGIGFAKDLAHNLEILRGLNRLSDLAPVVLGGSRKAFVGKLTGREGGRARMAGSLAAVAAGWLGHAAVVRVHDVAETVDFLSVLDAIGEARG